MIIEGRIPFACSSKFDRSCEEVFVSAVLHIFLFFREIIGFISGGLTLSTGSITAVHY